jgi:hypothetical protein
MELAAERAEVTADLAREIGWQRVRVDEDLFARKRYLVASREGSA